MQGGAIWINSYWACSTLIRIAVNDVMREEKDTTFPVLTKGNSSTATSSKMVTPSLVT